MASRLSTHTCIQIPLYHDYLHVHTDALCTCGFGYSIDETVGHRALTGPTRRLLSTANIAVQHVNVQTCPRMGALDLFRYGCLGPVQAWVPWTCPRMGALDLSTHGCLTLDLSTHGCLGRVRAWVPWTCPRMGALDVSTHGCLGPVHASAAWSECVRARRARVYMDVYAYVQTCVHVCVHV